MSSIPILESKVTIETLQRVVQNAEKYLLNPANTAQQILIKNALDLSNRSLNQPVDDEDYEDMPKRYELHVKTLMLSGRITTKIGDDTTLRKYKFEEAMKIINEVSASYPESSIETSDASLASLLWIYKQECLMDDNSYIDQQSQYTSELNRRKRQWTEKFPSEHRGSEENPYESSYAKSLKNRVPIHLIDENRNQLIQSYKNKVYQAFIDSFENYDITDPATNQENDVQLLEYAGDAYTMKRKYLKAKKCYNKALGLAFFDDKNIIKQKINDLNTDHRLSLIRDRVYSIPLVFYVILSSVFVLVVSGLLINHYKADEATLAAVPLGAIAILGSLWIGYAAIK